MYPFCSLRGLDLGCSSVGLYILLSLVHAQLTLSYGCPVYSSALSSVATDQPTQ